MLNQQSRLTFDPSIGLAIKSIQFSSVKYKKENEKDRVY